MGIDEDRKLPRTFYHNQKSESYNERIKGDVRNGGVDGMPGMHRSLGPMLKELPDYDLVWSEWTVLIRDNIIKET